MTTIHQLLKAEARYNAAVNRYMHEALEHDTVCAEIEQEVDAAMHNMLKTRAAADKENLLGPSAAKMGQR